jgi:molecular chaperone DnaK
VLTNEIKDILLLDVTPLSLGLETLGGVMTKLIERNTTIPVKKTEIFSTAADNQTGVDVVVYQGERPMAKDNMLLGQFQLTGIPAAARGIPQIEVTFDIDANGILNVSAKDKASGREQNITITASTNLSEKEIDRMVREADQNRAADERRAELVKVHNDADTLIYQVEKSLRDLGDKVPARDRNQIEGEINTIKETLKTDNLSAIRSGIQLLQNAAHALAQQAYAGQQSSEQQRTEDVMEGEFAEV